MKLNICWLLWLFYRVIYVSNQWRLYIQKMLLKHSKKWSRIKNQRWYGQTKAPNSKEKSKDFLKKGKSFIYNRKRNQVGICREEHSTAQNIIYQFLEENWSCSYITDLRNFVNIINSRVNRVTKLAPNRVFRKHEPSLILLALENNKYTPRFKAGDFVWIATPNETLRKVYTQNYTNGVFTITKIATLSPPTYQLVDANKKKILGKFYEPELVKVDVQEKQLWHLHPAMNLH